jgi:hypothetical protein
MFRRTLLVLEILVLLACWTGQEQSATAFEVHPLTASRPALGASPLFMFGGLADAFKNDDSLGARPNEGLKKGPNYNTAVTVNGKAVEGAVVGQKLTVVAMKARVKIPVGLGPG